MHTWMGRLDQFYSLDCNRIDLDGCIDLVCFKMEFVSVNSPSTLAILYAKKLWITWITIQTWTITFCIASCASFINRPSFTTRTFIWCCAYSIEAASVLDDNNNNKWKKKKRKKMAFETLVILVVILFFFLSS